ncbi:MAG: lysozyme inhibitor LprI family protein [Bauldia sp.]
MSSLRAAAAALALMTLGAAPPPAGAASFDCAKAATAIEKAICADPAVSALDSRLQERYDAVLALSLDPARLRSDQRAWLAETRADAAKRGTLAAAYASRVAALDESLADLKAGLAGRVVSADTGRRACLPMLATSGGGTCTVGEFGRIGAVEGRSFSYARADTGEGPDDPVPERRLAVFEEIEGGRLRLVIATDEDVGISFDTPRLLRSGPLTLLHLPASLSGTGNFNGERLFAWRAGAWRDVDVTSWLGELERRLPAGLGAWKGIYPDYAKLTATTALWRSNDANCCPTGGAAEIVLAWQGDRIVLKSVQVRRGGGAAERAR